MSTSQSRSILFLFNLLLHTPQYGIDQLCPIFVGFVHSAQHLPRLLNLSSLDKISWCLREEEQHDELYGSW